MKDSKDFKNEEICEQYYKKHWKRYHNHAQGGNMVYCLGIIGATIFFISQSTSFWMGVLGFLKALVWPVFMVYEALKFLM